MQASPTVDAEPSDTSSGASAALVFQRSRFADDITPIRACDSIRSVWKKYTAEVGGSSIRSVHECDKDAWSAKRNWPENKYFQAWQKWESIIDGVNLHAEAITVVQPQLGKTAAEEIAVDVLEFRQQRLKFNLQMFRERILTKQALGNDRLKGPVEIGEEAMKDHEALCAARSAAEGT